MALTLNKQASVAITGDSKVFAPTPQTVGLTSIAAGDAILLVLSFDTSGAAPLDPAPTSSGLTFIKIAGPIQSGSAASYLWMYYALGAAAGSPSIAFGVVNGGNGISGGVAYAISVSGGVTGLDNNGGLPKTASLTSGAAQSLSTSKNNDFIFGSYHSGANVSAGAGWTGIFNATNPNLQYKVVASPQSGLSVAETGVTGNTAFIGHAFTSDVNVTQKSISVSHASSVTVRRNMGKIRTLSQSGGSVSLIRQVCHGIALSMTELATLLRANSKSIGVSQNESVSLTKQLVTTSVIAFSQIGQAVTLAMSTGHGVLISMTETVTVRRAISRSLSVIEGINAALARSMAKLLPVSQPQAATRLAAVGHAISASQSNAATALAGKAANRAIVVTMPEVVTIAGRAVSKMISTVNAQAISVVKAMVHALSITTANVATLVRSPGKLLIVAQSNAASIVAQLISKSTFLTTLGQHVTLSRAPGKVVAVSSPELITMGRNLSKIIGVAWTEVVTLPGRGIIRVVAVVTGQVITITNLLGHGITATNANVASLMRTAGKLAVASHSIAVTIKTANGKFVGAVLGQAITMRRAIVKIINPLWPQHVTITRFLPFKVAVTIGQVASLVRSSARHIAVAQGIVASMRPSASKLIVTTLAQVISRRAAMIKSVAINQPQVVSLRRGTSKRLMIVQGQVATLKNVVAKSFSLALAQAISMRRGLIKRIVVASAQLVTIDGLGHRGHEIHTSTVQSVIVSRSTSKRIVVRLFEVVGLAFAPVVRFLTPGLIAFGGFRKRIVWEVSNTMAGTNILEPAIEPVTEVENVEFDYGQVIADGVTILSAVLTCSVYSGTDATPAARLISYPVIGVSTRTGKPSAAVLQTVGTMLDGVTYKLLCAAVCSDGQTKVLETLLPCGGAF